jgi:hypothetical protein
MDGFVTERFISEIELRPAIWNTKSIIIILFTAIGFATGGSGPYTTQLQQKTYNINNKKHTIKTSTFHRTPYTHN